MVNQFYMKKESLNKFSVIEGAGPVDCIISEIRDLIAAGNIKPGDRLPSQRKIAEQMQVGRMHVRDAIGKLEFYGILKTYPQSGTYIAGLGIEALNGLIANVLKLEQKDFASLVETRVLLEIESAGLAAERRTDSNLADIKQALENYHFKIKDNNQAVSEDMLFHLAIAEATQNGVLKSLLMIIIPDIIKSYLDRKVSDRDDLNKRYRQHKKIFECIMERDKEKASLFMKEHLKDILALGRNNNNFK